MVGSLLQNTCILPSNPEMCHTVWALASECACLHLTCLSSSLQNYVSKSPRPYFNPIQAGPRWLLVYSVQHSGSRRKIPVHFLQWSTSGWCSCLLSLFNFINGYMDKMKGKAALQNGQWLLQWRLISVESHDFFPTPCLFVFLALSLSAFLSAVHCKATLESCFTRNQPRMYKHALIWRLAATLNSPCRYQKRHGSCAVITLCTHANSAGEVTWKL